MKKILIFITLIILLVDNICAQVPSPSGKTEMLMKYWYYRDRLKREFMPSYNVSDYPGMFSPASISGIFDGQSSNTVQWGDGTIDLAFFMAVLGMEWSAENYQGLWEMKSKTLKELVFALEAFDHLDGYSIYYHTLLLIIIGSVSLSFLIMRTFGLLKEN